MLFRPSNHALSADKTLQAGADKWQQGRRTNHSTAEGAGTPSQRNEGSASTVEQHQAGKTHYRAGTGAAASGRHAPKHSGTSQPIKRDPPTLNQVLDTCKQLDQTAATGLQAVLEGVRHADEWPP
mmetsp:Transcript_4043/g.10085  ORF Transcript_4043/g.10085 Transcript_4043/m.10085 type:complete len:125 (+) Transcript_4043:936-1310(+)